MICSAAQYHTTQILLDTQAYCKQRGISVCLGVLGKVNFDFSDETL